MRRSDLYFLLNSLPTEFLLYAMGKTESEDVKKAISLYFTGLKSTKVSLSGKDLRRLGYIPGPIYSEILHALLRARLDGKLHSRREEIEFVLQRFDKNGQSQGRGTPRHPGKKRGRNANRRESMRSKCLNSVC
jgi:tRNA nucleotidyltransferase (CCA-adding enzyme)